MLALLAQAKNANGPDEGFLAVMLVVLFVVLGFYLVMLIVGIFFLLTVSKALGRCHPDARTMEPGMVWLNLIPLFGLVWMFITHIRVAESLKYEFQDRGWHRRGEDYGQTIGIVSTSLVLGSNMMGYCGLPVLVGGLVCWIIYWVRIAGFSAQLASRGYDRYDDEYDDRDDEREDDRKPWERRY